MKRRLIVVFGAIALFAVAMVNGATMSFAAGSTRYVSPTGNDTANDCLTPATPCQTIQYAVNQAVSGDTVQVAAGTYDEDVVVGTGNVTLQGAGIDVSTVTGPIGGPGSTIAAAASDVVIDGFTITRDGNNTTDWNNPGLNTAGVSVQGLTNTVEVRNSKLTGNRTGVDVNNSNGNSIHNDVIDFNRTGLIFRNQTDNTQVFENYITNNWTVGIVFLDGSGGTNSPEQQAQNSPFHDNNLAGNWYGQIVDRQTGGALPAPGTNLKDFSTNWFGTTSPVITTANSAEPGYAAQIPAAYGGTATPPGGQPDIAGPASANFDFTPLLESGTDTNTNYGHGTVGWQGSFNSVLVRADGAQTGATERIQEGVYVTNAAGTTDVGPGTYNDASPVNVAKALHLAGANAGISPNDSTTPLNPNPARVAESIVAVTGGTHAVNAQAPNVAVDGFTFQDSGVAQSQIQEPIVGAGVNFGGAASGINVENNIFDSIQRIGVYFNGPTPMNGGTIQDNRFANPTRADTGCNMAPTSAPGSCGRQLMNPWMTDHLVVQRNVTFAPNPNNDRVRTLNVNSSSHVQILDNTLRSTCHFTCMTVSGTSTDVTVEGNDAVSQWGNAFQLFSDWSGGTVQVDHNTFSVGGDYPVVVDNPTAVLTGVHVNRNSLGDKGVRNGTDTGTPGTNTIDAECNWWGSASGPDTSAAPAGDFFGPVDFAPWLTSSNLDAPCAAGGVHNGSSGSDTILIENGPAYGCPANSLHVRIGLQNYCPAGSDITVDGQGGKDDITIDVTTAPGSGMSQVTVLGGTGKDTLHVENAPASGLAFVVDLGAGNDKAEFLNTAVMSGSSTLSGGANTDILDYSDYGTAATVDLSSSTGTGAAGGMSGFENVTGSPFVDHLTGDSGNNSISGGDSGDDISGLGANDTLNGNAGDDHITGGDGNDKLNGALGADQLNGGNNDDSLKGGGGDDIMVGGSGLDSFAGQSGADTLDANDGAGGETVDGGSGGDACTVNAGDTPVRCEHITTV